jgi:hypothetical protein
MGFKSKYNVQNGGNDLRSLCIDFAQSTADVADIAKYCKSFHKMLN